VTSWCPYGPSSLTSLAAGNLEAKRFCWIVLLTTESCIKQNTLTGYNESSILSRTSPATRGKFDRGLMQLLHEKLHWFDVRDRVTFKLVVMVHRCLNGRSPQYLAVHCVPLSSSQRQLRSAERNLLHVPQGHRLNTYDPLAFAIDGPSAGNSLMDPVRNPNSTEAAFRRLLKTFFVRMVLAYQAH